MTAIGRPRSNADTIATVLLFVTQLGASVLSFMLAVGSSLWLMLPICSDNCDSPDVTHFVHRTIGGAAVIVGGIVIAFLLAGTGALVAGSRRSTMWKWPALGLATVVVSFLIAIALWTGALR